MCEMFTLKSSSAAPDDHTYRSAHWVAEATCFSSLSRKTRSLLHFSFGTPEWKKKENGTKTNGERHKKKKKTNKTEFSLKMQGEHDHGADMCTAL